MLSDNRVVYHRGFARRHDSYSCVDEGYTAVPFEVYGHRVDSVVATSPRAAVNTWDQERAERTVRSKAGNRHVCNQILPPKFRPEHSSPQVPPVRPVPFRRGRAGRAN